MPAELYLKKSEERRLRAGHLWVYSNEINTAKTPLKQFKPGDLVTVMSSQGQPMGVGYINPNTLLAVRLLSRKSCPIDVEFFQQLLVKALAVREAIFSEPYYRLVYGESDGLPGLVVDRYDEVLVVQITTAGMEALKDLLIAALLAVLQPKTIVLRNDSSARANENLESYVEVVHGNMTDELELVENGVKFIAPLTDGQKTAWFYDHRDNRGRLKGLVKDKRVLDVFSYLGGWGIQALSFGAKELVSIDSSAQAIAWQERNAKLNGVADKVRLINDDAFVALKQLHEAGEQFDVVVIDPPAFIKRRKDHKAGTNAYFHLNQLALQLLNDSGLLVSASCSQHFSEDDLLKVIRTNGNQLGCHLRILARGHQGLDHPVHPTIPETAYLKAYFIWKELAVR